MKKLANIFKSLGFSALSIASDSHPLAGVVKSVLKEVFKLEDASNVEEEVERRLAGEDPEVLVRLREANNKLRVDLEQAGIDLFRLEVEDRASARAREIALKDGTPKNLAYITMGGFFGLLGALVWMTAVGTEMPEGVGTIVKLLTGSLGTILSQQMYYYYGSSVGSKRKTEIMNGGKGGE